LDELIARSGSSDGKVYKTANGTKTRHGDETDSSWAIKAAHIVVSDEGYTCGYGRNFFKTIYVGQNWFPLCID
jgi:hypothetical protein